MKFKLNSLEKRWVLYDVANSAFTLLISTIIPIYFNYLAGNAGVSDVDYLAYWGYATSAATVLVAVLGPVLGSISDFQNRKKSVFLGVLLVGAAGCVFLGFVSSWFWFLLLFVITRIAYSLSLVIYDSMLPDVTTKERMDELSARGYAWGYIGSCLPFLLSLLLVLFYEKLGLTMASAMTAAFVLTAVWWLGLAIPLLGMYRQKHYIKAQGPAVRSSFGNLGSVVGALAVMFLAGFLLFLKTERIPD